MGGFVPVLPSDDKESDSLPPKVKDSGDQDRNFGVNFADSELSEDFLDFSFVEEWFDNLPPGSLEFWSSMDGDSELGLAGNGVSVKVEDSEGHNIGSLWGCGGVSVKVEESGGEKIGALCGGGGVTVKVEESEGEKIGALSVGAGVSVKVEEREVGDVGAIGGGIGWRGEGVSDVEGFVEREMGRVCLGCWDHELSCGGGSEMGLGELKAVGGQGVSVKTDLGGANVVVSDRTVVDGVDGAYVNNESACRDGKMADNSIVIGGVVMESDEQVNGGQHACEDVKGEYTKEGERGSSSDASSSSSSRTSDDDSYEENEDCEKVNGTLEKQGGVKADEEMDEMEEGEIREANEQVMPAQKEFTEREADDDDADQMVDWSIEEIENDGINGFSDDENEVIAGPIMSKNELKVLPPVPSVSAKLEPHHEMVPIGPVLSIVELQVVVEGCVKHNPLNEGSILWISETRSPLGFVDEIFGPVKNPYYLIRYNSKAEIPAGIQEGTLVSSVPEYASYVLNQKDLYKKGYDLSGKNDEEISGDEEFSDDEKEAEHRRMQRMAKRDTEMSAQNPVNRQVHKKKDIGRNPNLKPRPFTQQMPISQSGVRPNRNEDRPSTRPSPTDDGSSASSSAIQPGYFGRNNDVLPFPFQMPNGGNSGLQFNPSLLSGLPLQGPADAVLLNAISLLLPANNAQFLGQTAQFPAQTAQVPAQTGQFPAQRAQFPAQRAQFPAQRAQFPAQPMVRANQVPFQLGFNPCQNMLSNLVSPGVQSNPFANPASAPWSGPIPQNGFNPAGVGMNPGGQLDANSLLLFANALGIHLGGGQSDQSLNTMGHPPAVAPTAPAMTPPMQGFGQFNHGASSGRGNRPFRRGGGRFFGGRGRGRSNNGA